jgi:D-alanine transaminase
MSEIVYLNGDFMRLEDARVPVLDRGFIFGDGIYEVIPVYSKHPFRMQEHLARFRRSHDAIRLAYP